MSGKRGRHDGGGGRPNKKRYVNKAPGLSSKGGIPSDSRGILVSCTNSKEQQAGREAIAFLTESYEQLGGTWTQQAAPPAGDGVPTDFEAALASEVAHLKEQSRRPFLYHSLGLHSIVYLECRDREGPSPAALVAHACERVAAAQQVQTRHCSRFYPVEHTCYASLEKMADLAEQVVAQHFPAGAEGVEFAVVYDARAGPQLDRMDVINAFATRVPEPHKVNLGAPQKAILVNVVKAQCGVAVVERFKELCRFNVRTLALPEEEREAQREAQRHATQEKGGPDKAAGEQQAQRLHESHAAERGEGQEQQAGAAQAAGEEQRRGRPSGA